MDPDTAHRRKLAEQLALAIDGQVSAAATSAEALARLDAEPGAAGEVAMLVAHCLAPEGGGLALWRAVRQRAGHRAVVACVLIVGEGEDERAIADALAEGADVVRAPVREAELIWRVRRAMVARSSQAASAVRERKLTDRYRRLERRRHELEHLVHVDALTGVVNRRHIDELLDIELRRAQRAGDGLALVVVDVDFFHELNEVVGHVEGDLCLTRIAGALARELRRPSDVVGRYGGDEFVVLLPHTDAAGGARVAERLRRAVVREAIPHETQIGSVVTVSLGVGVMAPGTALSAEELFARADERLLQAKRQGRNRWAAPTCGGGAPTLAAGTWPAPVRVDPTLYDRLPQVLARKRNEIDALDAAEPLRALGLAADLRRLGRDLGSTEVVRQGARLERALRAGDAAAVARIAARLRAYLDRVPVIYLRD